MLRDRRNAIIWALGMWLVRRTARRRTAAHSGGGKLKGFFAGVLKLAVVGGIAFVVWRRFFAGGPNQPAA